MLAYGFNYFYDGQDLDLPEWSSKDSQIVDTVLAHSRRQPLGQPFFKYVGLVENHGTHDCVDFTARDQFIATFVKTDDFALNCTLNQYLAITRSTERGFIAAMDYLRALEHDTGRPWVVLIFGDHQPHTMSMSSTTKTSFMELIARGDERITFWHLASSLPGVVSCCDGAPPALSMLPSLISGFVAPDLRRLYLPAALYAHQQCGSDLMGRHRSAGLRPGMFDDANYIRPSFCAMYPSLLAAFQRFEVFGKTVPR